jgi:6-methylsalicylate decarboxylase
MSVANLPSRSTAFKGLGRIDVHHHCFPGTVDELQSEFEHNSYNLNYTPFPKSPKEHLEYMDEVGIQTAIIVRPTFIISLELSNNY